LKYAEYAVVLT